MAKNETNTPPSSPVPGMVPSNSIFVDSEMSPSTSITSNPTALSESEAKSYYRGLPSNPSLVARTSTTLLEVPRGLEAYMRKKELRVVGNHPIENVWEAKLAHQVLNLLNQKKVQWTSVDVVRIGYAGDSLAPVIIWIGVLPQSLSTTEGYEVTSSCQDLLKGYDNLADVEVEIRNSNVFDSAGSPLLQSPGFLDPTAGAGDPLTPALGLSIGTKNTRGTGGFFVFKNGDATHTLYLVTARHVVLNPYTEPNQKYEYKSTSQPRKNVYLLDSTAFNEFLTNITNRISATVNSVKSTEGWIARATAEGKTDEREMEAAISKLNGEKEKLERLNVFKGVVCRDWADLENRLLGHVVLSPPIGLSVPRSQGKSKGKSKDEDKDKDKDKDKDEDKVEGKVEGKVKVGYTEDFAIVEIESSKINASNFQGNFLNLGQKYQSHDLMPMMYPHESNQPSFQYPAHRLLPIWGTISLGEQLNLKRDVDQNQDPCLMVLKNGNTSGLTVGRANNLGSYRRNLYGNNELAQFSKEWPILPRTSKSEAFSQKGDSGAVVVDGSGRIGGLLTGGAGSTSDSFDISYATPIEFLKERMEALGFSPNLSPAFS